MHDHNYHPHRLACLQTANTNTDQEMLTFGHMDIWTIDEKRFAFLFN